MIIKYANYVGTSRRVSINFRSYVYITCFYKTYIKVELRAEPMI